MSLKLNQCLLGNVFLALFSRVLIFIIEEKSKNYDFLINNIFNDRAYTAEEKKPKMVKTNDKDK